MEKEKWFPAYLTELWQQDHIVKLWEQAILTDDVLERYEIISGIVLAAQTEIKKHK